MLRFENRAFDNENVRLDGNEYVGCTFRNSRLVFTGTGNVFLERNAFGEGVFWDFQGPAGSTIAFLSGIYHGAGASGREFVEGVIRTIREGFFPVSAP